MLLTLLSQDGVAAGSGSAALGAHRCRSGVAGCSIPSLREVKRSWYPVLVTTARDRIITSTEPVFDLHGFAGSGVDRLTEAAGVSSRTLYKHLGSKSGLVAAVLDARRERFAQFFDVATIDELFNALARWVRSEGARGCLFLRAAGEDGASFPEVSAAVAQYRELLHQVMRRVIQHETGSADEQLAEQLLVLFEGATSAASYDGKRAIDAARTAGTCLVAARK